MAEGEKGKGILKIGLTVCMGYNLFLAVRIHDTFFLFFFFCSLPFYFISIFFFVKVCKSTDRCCQYEATLLCFPYGETCSETNFYLTPLKKRMIWKKKKRNKEVGRPIFTIWYTYTKIGEEKRDKWII